MLNISVVSPDNHKALQACYQLHQQGQPYPWSQQAFFDMTTDPYTVYAASDPEQGIVGYALTHTVLDEVSLMDICVGQSARKQGAGQQLLTFVLDHCTQLRHCKVFLEVREHNIPAQRLYIKLGFNQVGLRKNYYPGMIDQGEKEHAVLMEKTL